MKKFVIIAMLSIVFNSLKSSESIFQEVTNKVWEESKNKILEEFNKISFDDVKNFISSEANALKKQIATKVLKEDVEFKRPADVTRYTSTRPKDLSISGKSYEADFLNRYRLAKVQDTLQKITGKTITNRDEIPRIALVFSGGGYRALTLTAGYMKAFEELGILDSALYVNGLSGSTWYLGPWIFAQDAATQKKTTAGQYYEQIRKKIEANTFDPFGFQNAKTFSRQRFADDIVFPKLVFGQPIGIPDIFGAALAHAWFGSAPLEQYAEQQQKMRLSNQYSKIQYGNTPWPIYTAISMHKTNGDYRYNWYEFSTEEVRNLENGLAIPAFAFGRQFEYGKSKGTNFDGVDYFAPEQSFGTLLGIFGSAYTVNAVDLYRIFFLPAPSSEDVNMLHAAQQTPTLVQAIKDKNVTALLNLVMNAFNPVGFALMMVQVAHTLLYAAQDSFLDIGKMRVAPEQVFNPWYQYKDPEISQWLTDREKITFIDAGIHYNIPLRPMFVPERKIDIIFVGEASGVRDSLDDLKDEPALDMKKAFADIERVYGITYNLDAAVSDLTMRVYKPDQNNAKAPIIVYFNYLIDTQLFQSKDNKIKQIITNNKLTELNLTECLKKGYCSTFNFSLTKEQFTQLSSIAYMNVISHWNTIKSIISSRMEKEEDWFVFGAPESELNVKARSQVPDIIIPASSVTVPALELQVPSGQETLNLSGKLDQLNNKLGELQEKLHSIVQ